MLSLIAKLCFSRLVIVNNRETQQTRIPLEDPMDGHYSKQSNLFGVKFLTNRRSEVSLFVSCKQTIAALLSSILFLISSHLSLTLTPQTFQHKIFHEQLSINKPQGKSRAKACGTTTIPKYIKVARETEDYIDISPTVGQTIDMLPDMKQDPANTDNQNLLFGCIH